jgi:early secretory antigenic target protein ESAT-6
MSDSHLSVNFVRLAETSSHIQGAIGALQTQLDSLEKAAAPLVQTWSGDAQRAYQERQATWRQASADLTQMLQGIKRGLDESLADYQSTEQGNVRLFTG